MRLFFLFAIGLSLFGCSASNQLTDWPNYRGPGHDNRVAPEGLDTTLDGGEALVAWRKDVGRGYTVVTTANGLAYTAGWRDGQDTVLCFEPATGKQRWAYSYEHDDYDQVGEWPRSNEGGPVASPAIADGRLFHTSRDGRIFCLDAKSGVLIWQADMTEVFEIEQPRWGFAASPVVIDGVVYMDLGKQVAMRADNGEVVWQTKDFTQSYSSPTPFTHAGRDLLAAFPLDGLVITDRKTGEVVVHHPWKSNQPCHTASPVVFHYDKLFISSGFNSGGAVLQFDGTSVKVIWENKEMCNTMATSLVHDGHLYGFDQKVLRCVDALTGEERWAKRGLGQGTLLQIGGTMLVLSETGQLMSAPLSPEGFQPGEAIELIDFHKVWSCPVIANGRLFAKDPLGELVCLDLTRR